MGPWSRKKCVIISGLALIAFFIYHFLPINYYKLNGPGRIYQSLGRRVRNTITFKSVLSENVPVNFNLSRVHDVDDWQVIGEDGQNEAWFVYSAYLDKNRNHQVIIRVIAVTPSYTTIGPYCALYNGEGVLVDIIIGYVETTTTFVDSKYSSAFVICPLTKISTTVFPFYISTFTNFEENSNLNGQSASLRIRHTRSKIPPLNYPHEFGVSVQPIFNYDKAWEFIQWMEYHRIMGATYFVFYNISIGPRVSCVLSSYQKEVGMEVQVLPWTIPIRDDDILHNNGQNSQAADAILRSRGTVKHLLMIDVDEYIVTNPQMATNYAHLLSRVEEQIKDDKSVQYGFLNGIFDTGCDHVTDAERTKLHDSLDLIISKYNLRTRPFERKTMKFITKPDFVIEPGIHSLAQAIKDEYQEVVVDANLAYLHHYKSLSEDCDTKYSTIDRTGEFYSKALTKLVKMKLASISKTCGIESH